MNIGLMYPSDYSYTYSMGIDDICYTKGEKCNTENKIMSWLYSDVDNKWFISVLSSSSSYIFYVSNLGRIYRNDPGNKYGIYPVIYLKPNVKIKSGDGSIDNPCEFEL